MEILKYRGYNDSIKYKKKCRNCKTTMVYDRNDLCLHPDEIGLDLYVVCPVCGYYCTPSHLDRKYKPEKDGEVLKENRRIGF